MPGELTCLDAGLEYLEQGFSVIPLAPHSKVPLKGFEVNKYRAAHATEEELGTWFQQWPDANLAILTGQASGIISLDADGPQGQTWLKQHCPSSVYLKTSKGIHAIFRAPKGTLLPTKARIKPEIDIRADNNGYFVAPPSVHPDGCRYSWQFAAGLDGWEDLPEFPLHLFPELLAKPEQPKRGNLELDLSQVLPGILAPVESGRRNTRLSELAGRWIGKELEEDEVQALAFAWNAGLSVPLPETEVVRTVNSIWATHGRNHIPQENDDLVIETCAEDTITTEDENDALPAYITQPGGLLQELMGEIEQRSAVSYPLYNLSASIALLGTLAGYKLVTETGLRTNFYMVNLGYSGTGKDAPLAVLPQLLMPTAAHVCNGPTEITSSAALMKTLSSKPCCCFYLDEIGMLLKGLKNPASHLSDIPRILTKLYPANKPETKEYADAKNNITLPWHHLSFIGASTPEQFWDHLTQGDAASGFLARVLVFESHHDGAIPKPTLLQTDNADLSRRLEQIHTIQCDVCGGNLAAVPVPHVIGKTPEALDIMARYSAHYHERKNEAKKDQVVSAIYNRVAAHAHKLALVHALSLHGAGIARQLVAADSVRWAIDIMEYLTPRLVRSAKERLAETQWHALEQKVIRAIRAIRREDRPGATRRDIFRRVKGIKPQDQEHVLRGLEAAGLIKTQEWQGKRGFSTQLYCLVKV